MNYPENLKKGDTIGICAPSGGIIKPHKVARLNCAIETLQNLGYKVIETESVRKGEKARSTTARKRAEEFMELWENQDVKLILTATGGEFLCEMLDFLDFDRIRKSKPKWIQGYSDITGLSFTFNTILDIPTMYCQTVKDYAMRPLFRNLTDCLEIESGKEIVQESFKLYEKDWTEEETNRVSS